MLHYVTQIPQAVCEPAFCYAKQNQIDTPSKKEKTTTRAIFSFMVGMTGYSTVAKIHTLCALKASFQIFERRMRTCIRFANRLESTNQTQRRRPSQGWSSFLVGMTGFEPATSCSQSTRATNCATSRNYFID